MNRWMTLIAIFVLGLFAFSAVLITPCSVEAGKLEEAIAKVPTGTGPGQIDPDAKKGYMGIPGAPSPNLIVAFLWAALCGWLTSSMGAFGAVVAGVGHMTIFGLGPYADSFKKTSPVINKAITDSIRVSNQSIVLVSAASYSIAYGRLGRVVYPLAISIIIGSCIGSYLIPVLTAGKISFSAYQGWFGLFILTIAAFLTYETSPWGMKKRKKVKEAADAFHKACKEKVATGQITEKELGLKLGKTSPGHVDFSFCDINFGFKPVWAVIGGLVIASISAFLGVGGGFLYVPFMTSVVGKIPMYIVAGTSGLVMLVAMAVSVFSYLVVKGVLVSWVFFGIEMLGAFTGAMIGPRTQKYLPEVWLKRLFVIIALYVGLRYASKGFLGFSIVP